VRSLDGRISVIDRDLNNALGPRASHKSGTFTGSVVPSEPF
jgi:hypothetical protein